MSRFTGIESGPPIEIFALNKIFIEDKFEKKVNLTIGGKFIIIDIDSESQ